MCPSAYFNHSYNTPAGEGARDALPELVTAVLISGLLFCFVFFAVVVVVAVSPVRVVKKTKK